ncbi:hypothetical protein ACHAWF_011104 [Thalassiosira exigua]
MTGEAAAEAAIAAMAGATQPAGTTIAPVAAGAAGAPRVVVEPTPRPLPGGAKGVGAARSVSPDEFDVVGGGRSVEGSSADDDVGPADVANAGAIRPRVLDPSFVGPGADDDVPLRTRGDGAGATDDGGAFDHATSSGADDAPPEDAADSKTEKRDPPPAHAPPRGVAFRDVIGHSAAKLRLDEALLPLALPPDLASSVLGGIRSAPASILLHGPPGCGKTKLARAVAGEAQAAFLKVGPSDVLSKFVGESEASIRGLFREARRKARQMESRCAVIFFDEIDALGRSRVDGTGDEGDKGSRGAAGGDGSSRRVLAELLIQMTQLSNDDDDEEEEEEEEGEDGEGGDSEGEGDEEEGRAEGEGEAGCDGGYGGYDDEDGLRSTAPGVELRNDRNPGVKEQVATPADEPEAGPVVGAPSEARQQQPKPRVIVVAATNRPEDCDPALLRRFAVRVLVGLPSRRDRKKILRRLVSDVDHSVTSAQLDDLAGATEGWSGSDLESAAREACMAPVRECLRAAARLKRRMASRDRQRRSDADGSAREGEGGNEAEEEEAHDAARESLLESFRNLRPVTAKDFEDGIAFFLGDQQGGSTSGQFGSNSEDAHYDSSSSSEDEM